MRTKENVLLASRKKPCLIAYLRAAFIAYDGRPGELTYVAIIFPEDRLLFVIRLVFSIAFVSISV